MSALALDSEQDAGRIYARLMVRAFGAGNDQAFASMIATRAAGGGAMPPWLGLDPAAFHCLMRHHFPRAASRDFLDAIGGATSSPEVRGDEREELVRLMLMHKAGDSPSEVWMAHVVAAGCLASDHLWQDLGLWNRADLTALMRRNFPSLAGRNVNDMKWKRFLYKQLCEAEGIYTCRAPSCEVCTDYHACFGPEY
ncbi:nitrogen fixation protein NifQ [Thiocapsa roseopersicina]|uniref:Nitrogen fixation protein NifQ n=1 Tax=Thiocapsa roseopersicina TaxID=1058 RepID=A0A1H2UGK8_THIRO|nr:nitrogen fixation protein NifQ [Thiocapsa roseopersicina]SDW55260.1 nitrogen fixation protein NifQ [Thiocapsa roseopersicina]